MKGIMVKDVSHLRVNKDILTDLGFTKVITEQVEENSHWYVAINPEAKLRVAVNLNPIVHRTDPLLYLTLETYGDGGSPSRVYRGLVTPQFLYVLIELRKIK